MASNERVLKFTGHTFILCYRLCRYIWCLSCNNGPCLRDSPCIVSFHQIYFYCSTLLFACINQCSLKLEALVWALSEGIVSKCEGHGGMPLHKKSEVAQKLFCYMQIWFFVFQFVMLYALVPFFMAVLAHFFAQKFLIKEICLHKRNYF